MRRPCSRIGIDAGQRKKLERLCRYISRPAVAVDWLSLTEQGLIRYRLKTPFRDGTTDVLFEPLDFLARLAALVPPPRVHLTRLPLPYAFARSTAGWAPPEWRPRCDTTDSVADNGRLYALSALLRARRGGRSLSTTAEILVIQRTTVVRPTIHAPILDQAQILHEFLEFRQCTHVREKR